MTLRKLTTLMVAVVLTLAISASAETLVEKDNYSRDYSSESQSGAKLNSTAGSSSVFSLFDPSRFQMHHSYSVAFMSGSRGSQSIAMYLNSIDYELAQPLRLQIDIAYVHQPQTLFGAEGTSGLNGRILPSFRLLWQPSEDFHMSISYETRNTYYNPYYRDYYNRSLFGR